MLSELEIILSKYPNIINTLTAIGTIGAVVVSLYIALKTQKPKLKADLYLSEILNADEEGLYHQGTGEKTISIDICNIGTIPVYLYYLGNFGFKFPFSNIRLTVNPLYPVFKDSDLEIFPGKSQIITLSNKEEYYKNIVGFLNEQKFYPKFLVNFIKFKINTSNGISFNAKINKQIIKDIIKEVKNTSKNNKSHSEIVSVSDQ